VRTEFIPPTHGKRAYSINEVCKLVSCGRSRIFQEMRDGRLRRRKIGRRTVILADDLSAWLDSLDG
jgi:excisionase family DNA binding protein